MNQMAFRFFINEIPKFIIFHRKFGIRSCANNTLVWNREKPWFFLGPLKSQFCTFINALGYRFPVPQLTVRREGIKKVDTPFFRFFIRISFCWGIATNSKT